MSAWTRCSSDGKADQKTLLHLVFESHDGRCYGAAAWILHPSFAVNRDELPMQDVERLVDPHAPRTSTIAVIEMSPSSWLVAGIVPGIERQPLKEFRCR